MRCGTTGSLQGEAVVEGRRAEVRVRRGKHAQNLEAGYDNFDRPSGSKAPTSVLTVAEAGYGRAADGYRVHGSEKKDTGAASGGPED
ncbi:hypothetical protein Aph02nite_07370 [Actinoplanes philippinensis]|nr:hypothetical protein Aph02nite_07370 [Actinoplanes philippinensis]